MKTIIILITVVSFLNCSFGQKFRSHIFTGNQNFMGIKGDVNSYDEIKGHYNYSNRVGLNLGIESPITKQQRLFFTADYSYEKMDFNFQWENRLTYKFVYFEGSATFDLNGNALDALVVDVKDGEFNFNLEKHSLSLGVKYGFPTMLDRIDLSIGLSWVNSYILSDDEMSKRVITFYDGSTHIKYFGDYYGQMYSTLNDFKVIFFIDYNITNKISLYSIFQIESFGLSKRFKQTRSEGHFENSESLKLKRSGGESFSHYMLLWNLGLGLSYTI